MKIHTFLKIFCIAGIIAFTLRVGLAQDTSLPELISQLPKISHTPNTIEIENKSQRSSWGTGFVIAPGYILTAFHVIQQKEQLRVGPVEINTKSRSRWLTAEVVKTDPALDIALLKVSENLPVLKLNPSVNIPIGLEAYVIGYPQPKLQGTSRKITQGIVNGYRNDSQNQPETGMLQISAEVSQGNSGGPVITTDGTVIGMVLRKLNTSKLQIKHLIY
jgi:S1-C subfamily serine protease